uniref:Uncharacterized protein n=1 Tax=Oryza sativa subsp. japonica TaxID=39947 RepID=Q6Z8U7_ORYSJ|nr:hypothetical protein [Oryza sativa Japonica Group]BAD10004.1 hypothetical protein [Oryza sativa Japonica Group]
MNNTRQNTWVKEDLLAEGGGGGAAGGVAGRGGGGGDRCRHRASAASPPAVGRHRATAPDPSSATAPPLAPAESGGRTAAAPPHPPLPDLAARPPLPPPPAWRRRASPPAPAGSGGRAAAPPLATAQRKRGEIERRSGRDRGEVEKREPAGLISSCGPRWERRHIYTVAEVISNGLGLKSRLRRQTQAARHSARSEQRLHDRDSARPGRDRLTALMAGAIDEVASWTAHWLDYFSSYHHRLQTSDSADAASDLQFRFHRFRGYKQDDP